MKFDADGISSKVIPPLRESKASLSDAEARLRSISIPCDFEEIGQINTCAVKTATICTTIYNAIGKLQALESQLKESESKNKSVIDSLMSSISGFGSSLLSSSKSGKSSSGKSLKSSTSKTSGKNNKKSYIQTMNDFYMRKAELDYEINKKTTATVANGAVSFGKGVAKFGEAIVDAAAIAGTNLAESQVRATIRDKKELKKTLGYLEESQKETMAFVAKEHVNDAFNEFYSKNRAGKWLDENAIEPFKSNGTASKVLEEIGYVSGIATTGGILGGGAAAGAAVAAVAGTGRYTEEYWVNAKKADPKNWQTKANMNKGIVYGLANGAWEGTQWLVGSKLQDVKVGTSELLNSGARVAIDTVFNGMDTPYRAAVDSLTSDRSLKEAWEKQGGWNSVVVNTATGLIGSVGGEIFDHISTKKNVQNINNSNLNGNKISETKKSFELMMPVEGDTPDDWFKRLNNNEYGKNAYGTRQHALDDLYCFKDLFGEIIDKRSREYRDYLECGLPVKKVATTKEYMEVKDFIKTRYNMSSKDAAKIMTALDSNGACSYADICNDIAMKFRTPEMQAKFIEKKGFPIFKRNQQGEWRLNDTELITDLFMFANDESNGGRLIRNLSDGTKIVDPKNIITDQNRYAKINSTDKLLGNPQVFLSSAGAGVNHNIISEYLEDVDLKCRAKHIKNSFNECDIKYVKEEVSKAMRQGKSIHMEIFGEEGKTVRFIDPDTNTTYCNWNENRGGHAITITGMNEEGFIIATWGKRILIPFKDLEGYKEYGISTVRMTDLTDKDREMMSKSLAYQFTHAEEYSEWMNSDY